MAWRILVAPEGDAAWQMAVDEAVLEAVRLELSPPTLRLYGWRTPALSFGYSQRLEGLNAAGLELVRRPTGGRAVLHADDFTYMVATGGLPDGVSASYRYLAGALARAIAHLGLEGQLIAGAAGQGRHASCFASATQADLCALGRKLVGSAQVRRGGTVLQHGSLYFEYPQALADMVFGEGHPAPVDLVTALGRRPEWAEVEAAFRAGFAEFFGGEWEEGELTEFEQARAEAKQADFRLTAEALA